MKCQKGFLKIVSFGRSRSRIVVVQHTTDERSSFGTTFSRYELIDELAEDQRDEAQKSTEPDGRAIDLGKFQLFFNETIFPFRRKRAFKISGGSGSGFAFLIVQCNYISVDLSEFVV